MTQEEIKTKVTEDLKSLPLLKNHKEILVNMFTDLYMELYSLKETVSKNSSNIETLNNDISSIKKISF